jgi:hypothetical protein
MAFNLRSQSPLNQKKSFSESLKDSKPMFDKSQKSLSSSNTNTKRLDPTGEKRKAIYSDSEGVSGWMDRHPVVKSAIQIVDPTGISSHGDVKKAWNDKKFDSSDIIEPLGALPVVGKFGKLIKGAKIGTDYLKVSKLSKALRSVDNLSDIKTASSTPINQKKSPLQKQKLSPKAARAKAIRDLAYAKTDDRTEKKAHSQRMHRKSPGNKNMDYDHEDGRFESVKQNRGNEGEGTKKESGKNYKINKK